MANIFMLFQFYALLNNFSNLAAQVGSEKKQWKLHALTPYRSGGAKMQT